jgi:hypothetical protein
MSRRSNEYDAEDSETFELGESAWWPSTSEEMKVSGVWFIFACFIDNQKQLLCSQTVVAMTM